MSPWSDTDGNSRRTSGSNHLNSNHSLGEAFSHHHHTLTGFSDTQNPLVSPRSKLERADVIQIDNKFQCCHFFYHLLPPAQGNLLIYLWQHSFSFYQVLQSLGLLFKHSILCLSFSSLSPQCLANVNSNSLTYMRLDPEIIKRQLNNVVSR
ncbi:hypothetical protein RCL1_008873 [Eukaryota sp. TZLM3-RCL]